jgi:GDPmannose 4,6-dehydratase
MKTALITGITGQDGSYLAELLLGKGYQVFGVVRNLDSLEKHPYLSDAIKNLQCYVWDMRDQQQITTIIGDCRPTEVYNFAAFSSGAGMFDDPVAIGEVNGLAVTRILEAIRSVDSSIRFCQASSSELFGEPVESPQSENTLFRPRTPYGAAKLYAHSMIRIYRQHYGLYACSAILFNHESPRRGINFVTRKITHTAAKIKLGLVSELNLGNLDARRDWGFAGDTVRAMWLMLQQSLADDYVVATGITHSVRELCDLAFACSGLDFKDFVHVDNAVFRAPESVQLVGNASKAMSQLGWKPNVEFNELITMMVDADLQSLLTNK